MAGVTNAIAANARPAAAAADAAAAAVSKAVSLSDTSNSPLRLSLLSVQQNETCPLPSMPSDIVVHAR